MDSVFIEAAVEPGTGTGATGSTGATGMPASFLPNVLKPREELRGDDEAYVLAAFNVTNLRLETVQQKPDDVAGAVFQNCDSRLSPSEVCVECTRALREAETKGFAQPWEPVVRVVARIKVKYGRAIALVDDIKAAFEEDGIAAALEDQNMCVNAMCRASLEGIVYFGTADEDRAPTEFDVCDNVNIEFVSAKEQAEAEAANAF